MENEHRNMRDLGCANGWPDGSLEKRLVEMAHKAGYHFVVTSHNPTDTVYECKEAGLRYHIDSSD